MVTRKKAAKKKAAKSKKKVTKKATSAKKKVAKKAGASKKKAKKKTPIKKKITEKGTKKKKMSKVTKLKTKTSAKENFTPYKAKGNEEYMGPEQVAHFRTMLLTNKKNLMEEAGRTVHHMQDDASNFPDPNDRASQEEGFALELRTRDRERKLIKKIDDALAALDSGDYGYCEICGIEIGVRRLEARPTATLCIDCKTLDEIKEKQIG